MNQIEETIGFSVKAEVWVPLLKDEPYDKALCVFN